MKTNRALFMLCGLPFFLGAQTRQEIKQHFIDSVLVATSDTTKSCYIQLYHGEKMYGSAIRFEQNMFKPSYIYLDGFKVNSNQIHYYKTPKGFYINVGNQFAQRSIEGKINVYKHQSSRSVDWYYQIGQQPVNMLTYRNLMSDMGNNPTFIADLKKIRHRQNLNRIYLALGGGALVASAFIIPGASTLMQTVRGVNMLGGAIMLTGSLVSYPVDYIKAIELYNKTI